LTKSLWYSTFFALGLLIVLLLPAMRHFAGTHHYLHATHLMLLSASLAFLLMPFMVRLGFAVKLIDEPDANRKIHASAVPLTGGLGIYFAFIAIILFNFHFTVEMKAILFSSTLILITGILDDRYEISATIRLLVQIAASLILIYFGIRITFIPDWLGGIYTEIILTIIWLVGITNSMNFIDGMDGLASGTCVIYGVFFAIAATVLKEWGMMYLAAAIAGSCLGFFPHNFRFKGSAKIFLGDSGSTFLGFLLASFAMLGNWGRSYIDLAIPVLIMSVLIFDMTLTTFVRIRSGEVKTFFQWIHFTGRDHFHHRLTSLGLGPKSAALIFFGVSVCLGLEALTLCFANEETSILVLIHSFLFFVILGSILVVKTSKKET
jgi:UDP-GlcNAc:undecaprenyl-phosphate/decaprenyl-phosphate GlcNAc-1-phosphate transferase